PVQGGFTLAYTTDDGTATTADNDYVDSDNSLTFSGTMGEIENITVVTNGDLNIENNESFSVTLGAISGTTLGGSISLSGSPKQFTLINDEKDWGDAPTAMQSGFPDSYATLNADDGANHLTVPGGLRLGATIDVENDGQPNATATGDGSDEDGVTLPAQLLTGFNSSITVNSSGTGLLSAWVDFDLDGFWDEITEKVITDANVVAGNNSLSFAVPGTASTGTSFARFRLSTAGNLMSCCMAADGEVEDYQVTIIDNSISINDVTVTEGASGTVTASFTVSLSAPAPPGGVTFDIATQNNSATTGNNDYVANSLVGQSIPMGSQTYTFNVLVNGDGGRFRHGHRFVHGQPQR
ncbi:MAG: GEVED domain-containing protein, partial [Planctomycetota bacterium]